MTTTIRKALADARSTTDADGCDDRWSGAYDLDDGTTLIVEPMASSDGGILPGVWCYYRHHHGVRVGAEHPLRATR